MKVALVIGVFTALVMVARGSPPGSAVHQQSIELSIQQYVATDAPLIDTSPPAIRHEGQYTYNATLAGHLVKITSEITAPTVCTHTRAPRALDTSPPAQNAVVFDFQSAGLSTLKGGSAFAPTLVASTASHS